jgi:hypothetical protein
MKKLLIFTASLIFTLTICNAQDSLHSVSPNTSMEKKYYTNPEINSKEYFLAKSSRMNTTGWLLVGVGATLGVTGYFIYQNNKNGDLNQLDDTYAGYLAIIGGTAMVAVGIPVLIKSGYYKRKAMAMTASINLEPCQLGLAVKHFPTIGISIHL